MSQEPQTNAHPFVPPSPRFQPGGLGADSKDAKALVKGCERVSSRKSSSPGRKDSPSSAKRRRKTSKKMRSLVKHHKRRKSNASKQELQSHLDLACASQINLTTQWNSWDILAHLQLDKTRSSHEPIKSAGTTWARQCKSGSKNTRWSQTLLDEATNIIEVKTIRATQICPGRPQFCKRST